MRALGLFNTGQLMALAIALALTPPIDRDIVWGGDHIELQITAGGAQVEFDCASGTIDERIAANAQGAFTAEGTFTPESRGPVRDDAAPRTVKATYPGTIKDDAMSLRVEIAGDSAPRPHLRARPGSRRRRAQVPLTTARGTNASGRAPQTAACQERRAPRW